MTDARPPSEWLKLMLEEIEQRRAEEEAAAREREQRRAEAAAAEEDGRCEQDGDEAGGEG